MEEKIVIKYIGRPHSDDAEALIKWFCMAFDFSEEDNSIEHEIFKEIINTSRIGTGVSSKDLNKKLDMPRSTVIYHLNRFINSGIVVRKGRMYQLRSGTLEDTFADMRQDIENEFSRMMQYAQVLDTSMNDVYGRKQRKTGRKPEKGRRAKEGISVKGKG